ncbi:MAG: DUF192 domain-containing protein [Candidatus Paceibacterota bacterium]|jgi:hypothetical protein
MFDLTTTSRGRLILAGLVILIAGAVYVTYTKKGTNNENAEQEKIVSSIFENSKPSEISPAAAAETIEATLGDVKISLEKADSIEKLEKGLTEKTTLDDNQGMLYMIGGPDIYEYSTADMKFPVDIIWIDENMKVIGTNEDLQPNDPKIYSPLSPASYMVEIKAGFVKSNQTKNGDLLILPE